MYSGKYTCSACAPLEERISIAKEIGTDYFDNNAYKIKEIMSDGKSLSYKDGFDRIQVSGSRKRAHVTGDYELATNIKHYVHIDNDYFRGKRVLVIDDIYTTGQSSATFISAMQAAGADVLMALFLGRTKLFRKADKY